MKVVLHAGAHETDEGKLLECLSNNGDLLLENGTEVPDPSSYQELIRDILHPALQKGVTEGTRDILLDAILKSDTPERLILSNPHFYGTPKMAAYDGILYNSAVKRLRLYQDMFAGDDIEIFMGMRNPATFLPSVLKKTRFSTMSDFLRENSPFEIRWSDMIRRMRQAAPDAAITVWCNEDTPIIWGQIIREIAGLNSVARIEGEYAILQDIISPEGMQRFTAHLDENPDLPDDDKRYASGVALEKFQIEDAVNDEIDILGWDHEFIERLTDAYDEDVARITNIPDINLIMP